MTRFYQRKNVIALSCPLCDWRWQHGSYKRMMIAAGFHLMNAHGIKRGRCKCCDKVTRGQSSVAEHWLGLEGTELKRHVTMMALRAL